MDLGTIANRIHMYSRFGDFHRDVMQVWDNCMAFNPKGNAFHEMALNFKEKSKKYMSLDANEYYTRFLQNEGPSEGYSQGQMKMGSSGKIGGNLRAMSSSNSSVNVGRDELDIHMGPPVRMTKGKGQGKGKGGKGLAGDDDEYRLEDDEDEGDEEEDDIEEFQAKNKKKRRVRTPPPPTLSMEEEGEGIPGIPGIPGIEEGEMEGTEEGEDEMFEEEMEESPAARELAYLDDLPTNEGNEILRGNLLRKDVSSIRELKELEMYQKEELERGMNLLEPSYLEKVVEMLHGLLKVDNDDEEMELDIDAIEPSQQVKLYAYMVDAIHKMEEERIEMSKHERVVPTPKSPPIEDVSESPTKHHDVDDVDGGLVGLLGVAQPSISLADPIPSDHPSLDQIEELSGSPSKNNEGLPGDSPKPMFSPSTPTDEESFELLTDGLPPPTGEGLSALFGDDGDAQTAAPF